MSHPALRNTKLSTLQVLGDTRLRLLYTFEECESILSLSRSQLYRLVDQGDLETVKIGKSRRISLGQLEAFVQRLENSTGLKVLR